MKIHDDHMYHGAALIQIAEPPQFTAINSLRIRGSTVGNSYQINNDIAVSLKYACVPVGGFKEYIFNFTQANLAELMISDNHSYRSTTIRITGCG